MPGRILIADSIANNRIALKATLVSEYFEAICIDDAESLSQSVLKYQPDLILLATNLGKQDGYAICKNIKLNAFSAHIPVILYSNSKTQIDWGKALVNLVDDIHVFPKNRTKLISRIRYLYRQKVELDALKTHANAAEQFGFNDITVEFPSQRLKKSRIAVVNHPTHQSRFELDPLVGKQYSLSAQCSPLDVSPKTDLIILQGADSQCQLLSDLQANPNTRNVPIMCLLDKVAGAHPKRLHELGATDCMLAYNEIQHINTRIQSMIAIHQHKLKLQDLLGKRVKEAFVDPLTGLYNRRHAHQYLTKCFNASQKGNRKLVVMMLDIDNFKSINDTLGHASGDEILKQISERLSENVRQIDMIARVGGEEFLVLVPDASMPRAMLIAERLRRLVESKPFSAHSGKVSRKITVSIGIAKKEKHHNYATDLINCADQALYKAKAQGRNRIHIHAA
jgi:two-component system cell cycle response regulator